MPSLPIPVAVPFALGRIDELLAKIFAVAVAVLSIDVFRNGFAQLSFVHPLGFYLFSSALVVAILGALASAFLFGRMKIWYRALVFITLFAMISWPAQVVDVNSLPDHYKPYIWWAVGFASMAATGAFNRTVALIFLVLMPMVWLFVRVSPYGASETFWVALEDSLYSFLFSTSVSLLVMFLRHRAAQVDQEFFALSQTVLERTILDVSQLERVKINSIVHDNVVLSLDAAAQASSADERAEAARLATEAIGRLDREANRDPMARNQISSQAYFESLKAALERRSSFVSVKVKSPVDIEVPFEVAVGMAEAAFQAVANSLEHAPKANKRQVIMTSARRSIKLLVTDDGPGFRMSSVPRNRLGIRVAIFERLQSLGVKAKLNAAPGEGTTWLFEWELP
jgi:signal transduction histidine kinase